MTVRVLVVRGAFGELEADKPDHSRGRVGQVVDSVRGNRHTSGDNSREKFSDTQDNIADNADPAG